MSLISNSFSSTDSFTSQLNSALSSLNIQLCYLLDASYVRDLGLRIAPDIFNEISYFPLEWFVESDTGELTVDNKLVSNLENNGADVVGVALLPKSNALSDEIRTLQQLNDAFDWLQITVVGYDSAKRDWIVSRADAAKQVLTYKTVRPLVIFPFEDVSCVADRIQRAIINRFRNELSLKMGTLLDCLNPAGLAALPKKMKGRIRKFNGSNRGWNPEMSGCVERSIAIDYLCVEGMLEIRYLYDENLLFGRNGFSVPLWLQPARPTTVLGARVWPSKNDAFWFSRTHFHETLRAFKLATVFSHPEPVIAMQQILAEDEKLHRQCLFDTNMDATKTLGNFEKIQIAIITATVTYVKDTWMPNCCNQIRKCLSKIGRGAFDMYVDEWSIYDRSKARKLISLVDCRMADNLRDLVAHSIDAYCGYLCVPCEVCAAVVADFKWNGEDLRSSSFQSFKPCIFEIIIQMNDQEAYYVTPPNDFETTIMRLFDKAVMDTHFINIIDPFVMTKLKYPGGLYLSSLGLECDFVKAKRNYLQKCYASAIIPLAAYATEYSQFIEAYRLNVDDFMDKLAGAQKSTHELKEQIVWCRDWRDRLETSLPLDIPIGPFLVLVYQLKTGLVKKFELLFQRLLEFLAQKLTNEMQMIIDEYTAIMDRLRRRPSSIEDLTGTVELIAQSPEILDEIDQRVKMKVFEFDILDGFVHGIDDEQALVKWSAVIFPYRIRLQIEPTKAMFETATEQFGKQQTSDLVGFGEQMEALNSSVFNFSNAVIVSQTATYAVEVNRLWNAILDARKLSDLLNRRQALFGRTEIDLNPLHTLQESFMPFRSLWLAADEFVKLRETTSGNPLNNLDVNRVRDAAVRIQDQLEGCVSAFQELPNVQNVIRHFLDDIQTFEVIVNVLEDIKNPDWIQLHWHELCKATGLDIRPFATMTFGYCIEKGILEHRDAVRRISVEATDQRYEWEAKRIEEEERKRAEEQARMSYKSKRRGRKLD